MSPEIEQLGTDDSLDAIYRQFNAWFQAGSFELANEALTQVAIQEESVLNLVGYLGATLPAKSELPYRSTFYQEVWKDFLHRATTRDRIKRLLTGLE